MSDDQDKKKAKIYLTPPPPPPPSIEEITRGMQIAGSTQGRLPPEPPRTQSVPQATYTPETMIAGLQHENQQLVQALGQARQTIVAKDAEITAFNSSFKEIQVQLAQVGDMLKAKDSEIESLHSRIEKHGAEMRNRDGEASRWKAKHDLLEETVSRSKQDALIYQRKAEGFEKESTKANETLKAMTAEKAEVQAKLDDVTRQSRAKLDEVSNQFQTKLDEVARLSQTKIDELTRQSEATIEALHVENARYKDQIALFEAQVKDRELKAFTLQEEVTDLKDKLVAEIESKKDLETKFGASKMQVITGSDAIINKFNELLENALHSVMLVVPSIKELRKLNLKKLRPSVKAMASLKLDLTSKEDVSYVEELQKQYRVDIRIFTNEDRYGLNVDRGIVFIGVNSKTEPFGLITENTEAIDLFMKQFIIEAWTHGHPISTHSERQINSL